MAEGCDYFAAFAAEVVVAHYSSMTYWTLMMFDFAVDSWALAGSVVGEAQTSAVVAIEHRSEFVFAVGFSLARAPETVVVASRSSLRAGEHLGTVHELDGDKFSPHLYFD